MKITENTKLVSKDGNFHYKVSQLRDDKVYYLKRGGGWVYSIPVDKVDEHFDIVEEFPSTYKDVKVYLNSDPDHSFRAVCDPYDSWNGWAKPYFTRSQLQSVINAFEFTIKEESLNSITFEEDVIPAERIRINDWWLWELGAGIWTWSIDEVLGE